MASLDDLEGTAIEGTSAIVGVLLLVAAVWVFLKWRKLSIPYQVYPDAVIGTIAGGIDTAFAKGPLYGSSYQKSIDGVMGRLYQWASTWLPSFANSRSFADYDAANRTGDATIKGNDPYARGQ